MSTIQNPRKSWLATGSLFTLVGDAVSGAVCPFPALAATHLPPCLSVHSWVALLWYLFSPFFCEWAWQCLRLRLFTGYFTLSLSFFPLSLAIPQFRLLSHVSSLRLPSGHSGQVLTLSNAAHSSLFSPHLLVADTSVWGTSLLGIAFRHVICEVYLFIFPPSYVAL